MTEKEKCSKVQYEIHQKSVEAMTAWMDENFPTIRDRLIQEFINTYEEMLSTLGDERKSAPADLYKLDSYWALQNNAREALQILGEDINTKINEQLRLVYIEIYERYRPGEEIVCRVSEEDIQATINQARGKIARNSQARVWVNMTVLWDQLFGDLMYCTINHLSSKTLTFKLQEQFNKTIVALKTAFSDSVTYVRARAIIRRKKDDKTASRKKQTNSSSAGTNILLASPMSLRSIDAHDDWDDDDWDDDDDDWNDDSGLEIEGDLHILLEGISSERVIIFSGGGCEPCDDLNGMLWDESVFGDVPVPVHPNCCCSIEDAPNNPYFEEAESIADAGFHNAAEAITAMGAIYALILIGTIYDMMGGGGAVMSPQDWLDKWGDTYPV